MSIENSNYPKVLKEGVNVVSPNYPKSKLIKDVELGKLRMHRGQGDMWPLTWGEDGNMYAGAGDNMLSPMNFWKISDAIGPLDFAVAYDCQLIDNLPIDPAIYCKGENVDRTFGIKPAGLICIDSIIYFAVENINYGDKPSFNRQHNINAWIITTDDHGKTWNRDATPTNFFTGRLASPHFIQFGKNYEGAIDDNVYAYFPAAEDGNSYWENGDCILLGKVPKNKILVRDAWEFFTGASLANVSSWSKDDSLAVPIFEYYHMTGENHVAYNKGLKSYIMGNYSFIDENGNPRPNHQNFLETLWISQLTLFEAPNPWGPWSLFYRDDNWGCYGGYQPNFPTKWMSEDGKVMWMLSSGSFDDYNVTAQQIKLKL